MMPLRIDGAIPSALHVDGESATQAYFDGELVWEPGGGPTIISFRCVPAQVRRADLATTVVVTLTLDVAGSLHNEIVETLADGTRRGVPLTSDIQAEITPPQQNATFTLTAHNTNGAATAHAQYEIVAPPTISYFRPLQHSYVRGGLVGRPIGRITLQYQVGGEPLPTVAVAGQGSVFRDLTTGGRGTVHADRPLGTQHVTETFTLTVTSSQGTVTATTTYRWPPR